MLQQHQSINNIKKQAFMAATIAPAKSTTAAATTKEWSDATIATQLLFAHDAIGIDNQPTATTYLDVSILWQSHLHCLVEAASPEAPKVKWNRAGALSTHYKIAPVNNKSAT